MAHPEMSDQPDQVEIPPSALSLYQRMMDIITGALEAQGLDPSDYEIRPSQGVLVRAKADDPAGG
jgi:hypothetical protein